MSYIFPKRKLLKSDVVEPDGLNADVMPAVELLDGRINEHNVAQGIATGTDAVPLARGALQTPYYVARQVNPAIPGEHARPAYEGGGPGMSATPWSIPADNKWHPIGEGDSHVLSVNFTTGVSRVWVNGTAQLFWLPDYLPMGQKSTVIGWFTDGGDNITRREEGGWIPERLGGNPYSGGYSACVRFAIRVDGRIIEETITGRTDKESRQSPFEPYHQIFSERGATGVGGDSHSVSPAAINIRLGCIVAVGPGEHVVELVAKTVYRNDDNSGGDVFNHPTLGRALEPIFNIYNAQLLAVDIPDLPPTEAAPGAPLIEVFESESSVHADDFYAQRFEKLKDSYNKVRVENLSRGALNKNHLPSPVIFARTSHRTDDITITEPWHGFSNRDSVTGAQQWPGEGYGIEGGPWAVHVPGLTYPRICGLRLAASESDNGDTFQSTHEAAGGDFDSHTGKCFLIVFADVEIKDIDQGNTTNLNDVLACLSLSFTFTDPDTGEAGALEIGAHTNHAPEIASVFYNNTNFQSGADSAGVKYKKVHSHSDFFNASLMCVLDMTNRPSTSTRGENGVFTSQGRRPPQLSTGQKYEFRTVHLHCNVHPKGPDTFVDGGEMPGTEDAKIEIGNRSLSAILLRY